MPSDNTRALREAALAGASSPQIDGVEITTRNPFEATSDDVLACDAILLGTTENLGYMSGALKDFFDRIYYPCLDQKQGLPMGLYIRAGHDGTGTRRTTGLKWRYVVEPVLCRGDWDPAFVGQCRELGMTMAAGLEAGVF